MIPDRRAALKGLLCAAVASAPGAALPTCRDDADALARRQQMLLSLFADPERAGAVGVAYARTLPAVERTPERLAGPLVDGNAAPFETTETLRSSIAARIRTDFADGRVVCIDGWILAETEARLCALAVAAG